MALHPASDRISCLHCPAHRIALRTLLSAHRIVFVRGTEAGSGRPSGGWLRSLLLAGMGPRGDVTAPSSSCSTTDVCDRCFATALRRRPVLLFGAAALAGAGLVDLGAVAEARGVRRVLASCSWWNTVATDQGARRYSGCPSGRIRWCWTMARGARADGDLVAGFDGRRPGGGNHVGAFRRPILGFFGAWFFVLLAPSSSVVPLVTANEAEHRHCTFRGGRDRPLRGGSVRGLGPRAAGRCWSGRRCRVVTGRATATTAIRSRSGPPTCELRKVRGLTNIRLGAGAAESRRRPISTTPAPSRSIPATSRPHNGASPSESEAAAEAADHFASASAARPTMPMPG